MTTSAAGTIDMAEGAPSGQTTSNDPISSLKSPKSTVYKGKVTNRSWPQLPEDLVRYIATFYLHSLQTQQYCPHTWESRELWHSRIVYSTLRDASHMEKNLMSVCLGWHRALQNHLFWQQVVSLIDPMDYFASQMFVTQQPKPLAFPSSVGRSASLPNRTHQAGLPPFSQLLKTTLGSQGHQMQIRLTPWQHVRNIFARSCIICRINAPTTNIGLGNVHHGKERRTQVYTPYLGFINVCRDHERRKAAFCGLCLREAPILESATAAAVLGNFSHSSSHGHQNQALNTLVMTVACIENEDEETWPNVDATCRSCRLEWLWKKTSGCYSDREALIGTVALSEVNRLDAQAEAAALPPYLCRPKSDFVPNLQSLLLNAEDWETRQTLEGFLDLGEGTINEILCLAREKWWLRRNTKLGDMMMQALAARKWAIGGSAIDFSRQGTPDRGRVNREEQREEQGPSAKEPGLIVLEEVDVASDNLTTVSRTISSSGRSDVTSSEDGHNRTQSDVPLAEGRRSVKDAPDEYESIADDESIEGDEEDEDEEDDSAMLQAEESSVRELALGDWARGRILDGYWISPADTWYGLNTGYPPPPPRRMRPGGQAEVEVEQKKGDTWTYAVHPCPWTIEKETAEFYNSPGGSSPTSSKRGEPPRRQNDDDDEMEAEEESHPHWSTVIGDIPPSYLLCEHSYVAHQKQMRMILLPAMKNIVRKIVMECGAAATPTASGPRRTRLDDPAIIVSRMTLSDVVQILREEEGVWFEGVDWVERMNHDQDEEDDMDEVDTDNVKTGYSRGTEDGEAINIDGVLEDSGKGLSAAAEARSRTPPTKKTHTTSTTASPLMTGMDDEDDGEGGYDPRLYHSTAASASSGSGSGTSPVLSTTTLQTTPSPPMPSPRSLTTDETSSRDNTTSRSKGMHLEVIDEPKVTIPVSPVLNPPRLLRPIPYIPKSVDRFPQYTTESLRLVWREACAPLFQCRCKICERAAIAHAAANAKQASPTRNHSNHEQRAKSPVYQADVVEEPRREPTRDRGNLHPPPQLSGAATPPGLIRNHAWKDGKHQFEHEGEILELEEVNLEELEFDSDEVVEIDFEGREGKNVGDLDSAPYYFAKRDQQQEADQRREESRRRDQKRKDAYQENLELEKNKKAVMDTFTDQQLAEFGIGRDLYGNFIDLIPDEKDSTSEIIQSPIPSEDIGDTTSNADSPGSGASSRKRSCDHLELEKDGIEIFEETPATSPKRQKLMDPVQPQSTPRKRSPVIPTSPSQVAQRGNPAEDSPVSPLLRKRNSENLGADGDGGDVRGQDNRSKKAKLGSEPEAADSISR
ncbi:hypothetical protein FA15DRAFT_673146 [Coprinopsis marcescibilis]|uniref:Uncharacterized protein n=1 Tax=Coprinopsis marcescibilis TaxID=230819 RepID=A0A5C3KL31_COPMA|nr:hypothetical protein FA15DRAFT_673146 [Coprinopsis marcescibilis]